LRHRNCRYDTISRDPFFHSHVLLDSERTGEPEPLRFPVFHSEILKQSHWDAGESYGRIKIMIAEGLCREMRATDSQPPAFERFREVVGFAFQHAPPSEFTFVLTVLILMLSDILEFSGIAWPNDVMWKQAEKLATESDPYPHKPPVVPDHNAHAHSPRRASLPDHATAPMHCYNNPRECAFRGCTHPRHFASPQHQNQGRLAPSSMYAGNMMPPAYAYNPGGRNAAGTVDDPFLVPSQPSNSSKLFQRHQTQSSIHDVSMPDYRSRESRAVTEMSGVSYNRLDFERQVNHAAVEEIIKALSPMKQSELLKALSPPNKPARSGSMAPENSPADVASTAPLRSNMAARDKALSIYTDLESIESATDQSPNISRTTSNEERLITFTRARFGSASPADNIQSKKERDQARRSVEQTSGDCIVTIGSSGSKSRSPLIESLNINRQRSNSAGSKRKRSNSKLDQVTSAEQSPSGGTTEMSLGTSVFSPYHVIDDDDTVGGSRRRTLPSA
jgi:hypothetical protein